LCNAAGTKHLTFVLGQNAANFPHVSSSSGLKTLGMDFTTGCLLFDLINISKQQCMNLNNPYDKASLQALTLTADKNLDVHNLVVDFDGEVVLDPEIYFPGVPVTKYKFCTEVHDEHLRDEVRLAGLYDALNENFNGRGYHATQKYMGRELNGKIAA
jgi:hypothetical protein